MGCEYMGATHGSDLVCTADDALEMSMVTKVYRECMKCVCVWFRAG